MVRKVAVYGGSFNPSGTHHRAVVEAVAPRFDMLIVVPCGPRPDKVTTNDIEPIHRAAMADIALRGIPNVEVDLFDLEQATFTRTHALEERYAARFPGAEIWHVIGSDFIAGGKDGRSDIQRKWTNGPELWRRLRFVVVPRTGHPFDPSDLPPQNIVVDTARSGSSTEIRGRAFRRQSLRDFVSADIAAYIERYNLYRGGIPLRKTSVSIFEPRALIVHDERNPRAGEIAERLSGYRASGQDANCIVAVGGDGTMLHAIRTHWRRRLPFVGINAGHKGYLLNDVGEVEDCAFLFEKMHAQLLPLFYVECEGKDGAVRGIRAFNDAWVQCVGQCAWVEVSVDGRVRIPKLVGDGALIATAAGSNAYARAMGATTMLVDSNASLLVGSNVVSPVGWKSSPLSLDSVVELRSLDPTKRPLRAFVDGEPQGEVRAMRVRVSRIAAVELAFDPNRDMAAKLADDLFPKP